MGRAMAAGFHPRRPSCFLALAALYVNSMRLRFSASSKRAAHEKGPPRRMALELLSAFGPDRLDQTCDCAYEASDGSDESYDAI